MNNPTIVVLTSTNLPALQARSAIHLLANGPFNNFAGDLHKITLFA